MEPSPFSQLARRVCESEPFRRLVARVGEAAVAVERLPVPAAAWVLDLLGEEVGRPLLVILPRESEALAWVEAARLFRGESAEAFYFPSPSLTPYQETEISLPVRAQESLALDRIARARRPMVVCTPRALFRRLPQTEQYEQSVFEIAVGEEVSLDELARRLLSQGYRRTELVVDVGSFAVRGGVFDLFPPGLESPVRLDLFGDEVETLRAFDPVTQRSQQPLNSVRVRPLSLFPAGEGAADALAQLLEGELEDDVDPEVAERIADLARGETFSGWENYLPLVEESTLGLGELLERPLVATLDAEVLAEEARHHGQLLLLEHQKRADQGRLAIAPDRLEQPLQLVLEWLGDPDLLLGAGGRYRPAVGFEGSSTERLLGQLPRFPREVEIAKERGERLLLVGPQRHHERLRELLGERGVRFGREGVELIAGEIRRGFRLPPAKVVVFGESQLFTTRPDQSTTRRRLGPFLSGLRDLKVGEFVVHEDHGVGQYLGMRSLEPEESGADLPSSLTGMAPAGPTTLEVMEIVYSQGKSLLLPLDRLHQIQKYGGVEGVAPRLDRLGGTSWNRKKSRLRRSLKKLATDLLKLYAARALASAPAAGPDSDSQSQFEAAFEFDETEDQLQASRDIKADLEKTRPMDRLLCGDVGFGKTEVAMRAAFKMVDNGYQVAVLAPTTILADQHLQTFQRRFSEFPIITDMVSRFRRPAEVREIADRVEAGTVDILIGTHRLLSRDIQIPKLGLLVVDEEQRFGVGQKERLKELRRNVHVLSMSATPVPRTLQLSLAGVRDLSTIESPPKDRMAVETQILPFAEDLVREAIDFELERGGQIYYVYNRVEDIERISAMLRELVPSLRITVGHGQMDERELSRRMHAFKDGEHDLLLATTIIENGIDIPSVNTMIVHRADRFGLAQLYQLRGRVGRSNQLAFCYLLVPSDRILPSDARQRLRAIKEFSELGAGFRVAARDLEIRGAGNLLGAEQSGHIAEVGIETYLKMLDEAVRELRGETSEEAPAAHVDLPVPMSIPREYIGDTNQRMEIYRRLAAADEVPDEILEEMRDRFGAPPAAVMTFVEVCGLKRLAERLRVQSISQRGQKLTFRLRRDARVDVDLLIRLVSEHQRARFSPSGVLTLGGVPPAESLTVSRRILESLTPDEADKTNKTDKADETGEGRTAEGGDPSRGPGAARSLEEKGAAS